MLTHEQIWSAIDALAQRQGLTPSALARLAGLDPTTFNRSKRIGPEGHPRWPSTESIAKVLAATRVEVDDFLSLMRKTGEPEPRLIPFRTFEGEFREGFDRDGAPKGHLWDRIPVLGSESPDQFALGIAGDAFEPIYHDGATIILAPRVDCRRGDRVLVVETSGEASLAVFLQSTAGKLRLRSLKGDDQRVLPLATVQLVARILWVSQ